MSDDIISKAFGSFAVAAARSLALQAELVNFIHNQTGEPVKEIEDRIIKNTQTEIDKIKAHLQLE